MCKGPQTLTCVALSQMGKTKQNKKTANMNATNINTDRDDKDVLVVVDEPNCSPQSPYFVSSFNPYNHLRYTY